MVCRTTTLCSLQVEEAPSAWRRHDGAVLVFALVLLVGGALTYRGLIQPAPEDFSAQGLHFQRPSGWLPPTREKSSRPALAAAVASPAIEEPEDESTHLVFRAPADGRTRIEVRIIPRPSYTNLPAFLALERLNRYGEFYFAEDSGERSIGLRDWLRTRFRYAFKPGGKPAAPKISAGIEYATLEAEKLYVVSLHGPPKELEELDDFVSPTLRVGASPE